MHSFLGFKYYDHKDRNELNNRKHNLRLATQQENNFNKSVRNDNNSGITGISWSKKCKNGTCNFKLMVKNILSIVMILMRR